MGSAIVETSAPSGDWKRWILIMNLLSFPEKNGVSRVDFVKLDVDGSEGPVLGAVADFVEKYRRRLIIEVHYVREVRSDPGVIRILEGYGYEIEVPDQTGSTLPLIFAQPG